MEIRSVTLFCPPDYDLTHAADFAADARSAFPVPVQTTRAALPPFPDWWTDNTDPAEFATRWQNAGLSYVSLGTVRGHHADAWLDRLPDLVGTADCLFANIEIADTDGRIHLHRCAHAARIVQQVSRQRPNGFGNLFLTAVANCPPGSPFFPVATAAPGAAPGFALAIEAGDLAQEAIDAADTLEEAQHNLTTAIEQAAAQLRPDAETLAATYELAYTGCDFSLAPYPTAEKSLAPALEKLGTRFGGFGPLMAAAFITAAIDRADFQRVGFSGLMLPVLEDALLAERAAEGNLTVRELLLYSAVCGVGLDTVPLPGDVGAEALTAVLAEVAALATRLRKPLTARLMPLPGLQAGDEVAFDFPYFADSRVLAVNGRWGGLLAGAETIEMPPIRF